MLGSGGSLQVQPMEENEDMMSKEWSTQVIEVDGDIVLIFPEELLRELNLKKNEVLRWQIRKDGVFIRRDNFINNVETP
jgi:hypothetical protein